MQFVRNYDNNDNDEEECNGGTILKEIESRQNCSSSSFGPMFSRKETKLLELASILTSVNAPNYVFNDIIQWAQSLNRVDLDSPIGLHNLIHRVADKYNLGNIFPQTTPLYLPSDNTVAVTKYNFAEQLYSLLSDEKLMKPENLIFGDDPCKRFNFEGNEDHMYNDVETSDWYRRTQATYCTEDNDVLVPIILYIDRTYVKSKAAEPISFTLGIFKRYSRVVVTVLVIKRRMTKCYLISNLSNLCHYGNE